MVPPRTTLLRHRARADLRLASRAAKPPSGRDPLRTDQALVRDARAGPRLHGGRDVTASIRGREPRCVGSNPTGRLQCRRVGSAETEPTRGKSPPSARHIPKASPAALGSDTRRVSDPGATRVAEEELRGTGTFGASPPGVWSPAGYRSPEGRTPRRLRLRRRELSCGRRAPASSARCNRVAPGCGGSTPPVRIGLSARADSAGAEPARGDPRLRRGRSLKASPVGAATAGNNDSTASKEVCRTCAAHIDMDPARRHPPP